MKSSSSTKESNTPFVKPINNPELNQAMWYLAKGDEHNDPWMWDTAANLFIKLFQKNKNEAEAYYCLAKLITEKKISITQYDACELLKKCSELNHTPSMNDYGMFLIESGSPQQFNQGLNYLKKAADRGNIAAMYNYASSCYKGFNGTARKVAIADEYYRKIIAKGKEQEEKNSLSSLEMKTYLQAYIQLGLMLAENNGITKDITQAIKYLSYPASKGCLEAEHALCHVYFEMMFEEKDIAQQQKLKNFWVKKIKNLADKDYAEAELEIAKWYYIFEESTTNPKGADRINLVKKYFLQAYLHSKNPEAAFYLYQLFKEKKNPEAMALLKTAAEGGYLKAMVTYGEIICLTTKDITELDKGINYIKESLLNEEEIDDNNRSHNSMAHFLYAKNLFNKWQSIEDTEEKAYTLQLVKKHMDYAAEQKHIKALYDAASLRIQGIIQDESEAKSLSKASKFLNTLLEINEDDPYLPGIQNDAKEMLLPIIEARQLKLKSTIGQAMEDKTTAKTNKKQKNKKSAKVAPISIPQNKSKDPKIDYINQIKESGVNEINYQEMFFDAQQEKKNEKASETTIKLTPTEKHRKVRKSRRKAPEKNEVILSEKPIEEPIEEQKGSYEPVNKFDKQLPQHIKEYLTLLKGYNTYVYGGYVRNELDNRENKSDVDIVTDAPPEIIEKLVGATENPFKKNLFRIKNNNYSFDIRYAPNLKNEGLIQDAFSLDFTINALYLDIDNNLYDPTLRGLPDLKNKTNQLKTIKDEKIAFKDIEIILRYIYFLTAGFTGDYSQVIKENSHQFKIDMDKLIQDIKQETDGEKRNKLIENKSDLLFKLKSNFYKIFNSCPQEGLTLLIRQGVISELYPLLPINNPAIVSWLNLKFKQLQNGGLTFEEKTREMFAILFAAIIPFPENVDLRTKINTLLIPSYLVSLQVWTKSVIHRCHEKNNYCSLPDFFNNN